MTHALRVDEGQEGGDVGEGDDGEVEGKEQDVLISSFCLSLWWPPAEVRHRRRAYRQSDEGHVRLIQRPSVCKWR